MDLLSSDHTVPLEKADRAPKKVIDSTPQYATDGDPAQAIPATILTAAHYNSLMAEIVNAIKAGGLKPDKDDWGQLAAIITGIVGRFGNIKEVGKDEKGVYVIVTENGKDQKTYILTPSDLDDINKRLTAAEGTIINHTSRLDNYGDAINRIFSQELPSKAELNGNSAQDFNAKNLNTGDVVTGGLGLGGTNGVGTSNSLWGFSPQLLNDDAGNFSRVALLNLIYAGADEADGQSDTARQILQIKANRSQYTTGDVSANANKEILHTRSINVFADFAVYGTAKFNNGVQGVSADLSENYKSDRTDYQPGQVMMYAVKKGSEVELCTNPKRVFGIISTTPFATMNGKDENDPDYKRYVRITMIGRVPVLVEGPLTLDDHITATAHGTAIASQDPSDTWLGRPIEPDPREELRLVECFVKAVI